MAAKKSEVTPNRFTYVDVNDMGFMTKETATKEAKECAADSGINYAVVEIVEVYGREPAAKLLPITDANLGQ